MDRPQSHLIEATRPHLWLNALDARTALWRAPNDIQGIGTAHCCHRRYHPTRAARCDPAQSRQRSEEHTSELQSLMRNSYAVFCWEKKRLHLTDALIS